jgi:hypothetical protein
MYLNWLVNESNKEYERRLRHAENERLALRIIEQNRKPLILFIYSLIARLGHQLVVLGERLQAQHQIGQVSASRRIS